MNKQNQLVSLGNTGVVNDAAGNLTFDGSLNYTWDAENRLSSVAGVSYSYDGDGQRVQKSSGTTYWYGPDGATYEETDASGNTIADYIYFGGKRFARRDASNNTIYYVPDHLGTSRVIMTSTGSSCYDSDFYPFGGEINYTNTCPQNYKFTGKERDAESGLDNFGARYTSSSLGRFMSPDEFFKDSHVGDPQSWNEYAYARNNPLRYVDPNGENATVTTSCSIDSNNKETCNVNISASIAIYAAPGTNLTQDQLNQAASTMQNSIQNAWTGSFTQDGVSYNVSTQVSVSVASSQEAAMSSGAQNVIGMTNGPIAMPNGQMAGAIVHPKGLGAWLFGGPDTGMMDINGVDNYAKHEFTHLLGVGDRGDYNVPDSGPNVLSNTWPGKRPGSATGQDFGWGLEEATKVSTLGSTDPNRKYFGSIPTNFPISTTVHVGAPLAWWK